MSARVWREGGQVLKRLATGADRALLLARTEALREAGLATPAAAPAAAADVAIFDEIAGETGLARIVAEGAAALADLLLPLRKLHAIPLAGLPAHDPMRRIAPRLGAREVPWAEEYLARIEAPRPMAGGATLHGDFHAGQLIAAPDGTVWVLDLDDLAEGPPEADLGNFAAHLATRPETRKADLSEGFAVWLDATLAAYRLPADALLAQSYGRIALLRRALKFADAGDLSLLDEVARL